MLISWVHECKLITKFMFFRIFTKRKLRRSLTGQQQGYALVCSPVRLRLNCIVKKRKDMEVFGF